MTNDQQREGNKAAFPLHNDRGSNLGLTKREVFAAMALQGLASALNYDKTVLLDCQEMANDAVACADALLKELGK